MVGTGELLGQVTVPEATPVQGGWGGTGSHLAGHCSGASLSAFPHTPVAQGFCLSSLGSSPEFRTGPVPQPYFHLICLSVLKDHPSVFSPY